MKLDSKYFDLIRIKPRVPRQAADEQRVCQWKGCQEPGTHKAPRGRGREGQYYYFCLEHVRRFNSTYNYFAGMSDAEVEEFHKDAITGHRPTWPLGSHGGIVGEAAEQRARTAFTGAGRQDPYRVFYDSDPRMHRRERTAPRRSLRPLERKAFETLHLPEFADRNEIKAQFKALVKRHHPDTNGGDRGTEDKLREIIQAYNYLKQAGLV